MTSSSLQAPTIFVIFGATGDLSRKKILPALFHLFADGALPKQFHIVAFSRQPLSHDDYRTRVREAFVEGGIDISDEAVLERFLSIITYQPGQFLVSEDYGKLLEHINGIDDAWGMCTNKLFHLAVAPQLYTPIFENMAAHGLNIACDPNGSWTRILVEKPFGKDAQTAADLDLLLGKIFQEEQIYRLDHYLAKEIIQNILTFRFSNILFEDSWNQRSIETVELRLNESIGVEGRGSFYDMNGALRDVGQNHLLQMLAIIAMDHPGAYEARTIRQKRAEALQALHVMTADEVAAKTERRQYDRYHEVNGVDPGSHTETAFRVEAKIDTPRWQGVDFILEGGKYLAKECKEIVVNFRHPEPCLCPPGQTHQEDRLIFRLSPEEKIIIEVWSKKPGLSFEVERRSFELALQADHEAGSGYEKLLLDAIVGDQTLFVSTDEVRAMWRFIDPIVQAWEKNQVVLQTYKQG